MSFLVAAIVIGGAAVASGVVKAIGAKKAQKAAEKKAAEAKADGINIEGDGKSVVHSDNFPMKHTFADGIYVRQMDMKAGSAVVGAIHNHLHVWFLLTGHLAVATEDNVEEFIAPCYVVASPGSKRVIYAMEDSIFINVHKNPKNIKNIEKLEK